MIVDLGCGDSKRGDIGIDRVPLPGVDLVVNLGFEPFPFEDNTIDKFTAYDFLEHLPVSVWYHSNGEWQYHHPRIFLLREIYRCLKPGGEFYSQTPEKLNAWAQDPTHEAPPWVLDTWHYFTGGYGHGQPGDGYGIDFAFENLQTHYNGPHLYVSVFKPR